jgi:predicted unusual protein kinase regulating ubiquinone biosynthesis (AarF/ABC1/UbiB family)
MSTTSSTQWGGQVEVVALKAGVARVVQLLRAQLDLRVEAANLDEFRERFDPKAAHNAACDDWRVTFPRPLHALTTRRVLVEEFMHARHISAVVLHPGRNTAKSSAQTAWEARGGAQLSLSSTLPSSSPSSSEVDSAAADAAAEFSARHLTRLRKRLARIGLTAFLKMMLVDNLVHADLHPGNIMFKVASAPPPPSASAAAGARTRASADDEPPVTVTSADVAEAELIFLDAGLTIRLDERDRFNFLALFSAVATGDGRRGARLIVRNAPASQCSDLPAFENEMQSIISRLRASSLNETGVGTVMTDILMCTRKHRVALEGNFATLVTAAAVLEGLGRMLDPTLNIFHEAAPFLIKHVSKKELAAAHFAGIDE